MSVWLEFKNLCLESATVTNNLYNVEGGLIKLTKTFCF